ncbi:unnamed protein product [Protopolystoma xenopodis]|uniref:Uncharacterized protein n=1 Tax=Protopolystoma xenopodis TaxID=117903 RepID=A0A3S5B401_9PLAT|nr:unnamed protein product [Protopolystoma xenopodis]
MTADSFPFLPVAKSSSPSRPPLALDSACSLAPPASHPQAVASSTRLVSSSCIACQPDLTLEMSPLSDSPSIAPQATVNQLRPPTRYYGIGPVGCCAVCFGHLGPLFLSPSRTHRYANPT